jgi:ornithine cyclodeaminase/alanine dehydrogenase-like protein (mu-crystallin family)
MVAATNSLEPVLRDRWLKPGAHVHAVGSPRPTASTRARRALKESDEVILSNDPIFVEAGELFGRFHWQEHLVNRGVIGLNRPP